MIACFIREPLGPCMQETASAKEECQQRRIDMQWVLGAGTRGGASLDTWLAMWPSYRRLQVKSSHMIIAKE